MHQHKWLKAVYSLSVFLFSVQNINPDSTCQALNKDLIHSFAVHPDHLAEDDGDRSVPEAPLFPLQPTGRQFDEVVERACAEWGFLTDTMLSLKKHKKVGIPDDVF